MIKWYNVEREALEQLDPRQMEYYLKSQIVKKRLDDMQIIAVGLPASYGGSCSCN